VRRCAEIEALFVDAVDGRLDRVAGLELRSHLDGCVACRERAALWGRLVPGMRSVPVPAPDPMAIRRMELAIERQLARPAPPARSRLWAPALALVAAAALVAFWLRPRSVAPDAPAGYAAVSDVTGALTIAGRAAGPATRVPVGAPLALAAGGAAALTLDSGATVRVAGPARLVLEGSAGAVAVRLGEGRIEAQVTHRLPTQTFAVVTPDLRVEVRGTRFTVVRSASGSRVEVQEGRVAVQLADGRSTFVTAGGSADSATRAEEPPRAPPPPDERPAACHDVARACQTTARTVRASMRGGDAARALRLLADGPRDARGDEEACREELAACHDELGYLRAEALNQAGRVEDAATAYRALDRRGAPPAMRQNALYAAALLAQRQGHLAEARTDYERALAVAPRGALYEEALLGAMETARDGGDDTRARALAARYLHELPHGRGATAARRLLDGQAP
jgi:ferric-dicitrate binding protein FerR (iron transport regulator)